MKILLIILLILFGIQLITNKDGRFALNTLVQQVINIFYWFVDRPKVTLVGFIVLAVLLAGNSRGKQSENAPKTDSVKVESLTEAQNQIERTAEKVSEKEETKQSVPSTCDSPIWSRKYLLWYMEKNDISDAGDYMEWAKVYLERIKQVKEEGAKFVKLNTELFQKDYFSLTTERTDYVYAGELKDNRPSGFGVVWKIYEEKNMLLYCGNFSKGRYDGQGIGFQEYSTDIMNAVFAGIESGELMSENYKDYLETISYVGNFSDGEESGDGVFFSYPELVWYMATLDSNSGTEKEIGVSVGRFKKGQMNGDFKVYINGILRYEGGVKNGIMNGDGRSYFPDNGKIMYDGHWKNGKYDGKGTLYNESGEIVYSGKWDNGDYAS